MTVQTSTTVATGIGNGVTTVFPVGFRFNRDQDLLVILIETATGTIEQLTLSSDYTVQGAGNEEGGSVTTLIPVPTGKILRAARVVDLLQLTDLRNQGKFFAEVHEDAFDQIVMMAQQIQEQVDRAVKVPVNSDTPPEALYAEFKGDIALADAAAQLSVEAKNESQAIAEQFGDVASAVSQTEAFRDQSAISASGASNSAAQASTAADRAEAAEGNAFVNADLYETTAAGIAATAEGEQFQVLSSDGLEYVRYRHDTGGAVLELGRYPSANGFVKVDERLSSAGSELNLIDLNRAKQEFSLASADPNAARISVDVSQGYPILKLVADTGATAIASKGFPVPQEATHLHYSFFIEGVVTSGQNKVYLRQYNTNVRPGVADSTAQVASTEIQAVAGTQYQGSIPLVAGAVRALILLDPRGAGEFKVSRLVLSFNPISGYVPPKNDTATDLININYPNVRNFKGLKPGAPVLAATLQIANIGWEITPEFGYRSSASERFALTTLDHILLRGEAWEYRTALTLNAAPDSSADGIVMAFGDTPEALRGYVYLNNGYIGTITSNGGLVGGVISGMAFTVGDTVKGKVFVDSVGDGYFEITSPTGIKHNMPLSGVPTGKTWFGSRVGKNDFTFHYYQALPIREDSPIAERVGDLETEVADLSEDVSVIAEDLSAVQSQVEALPKQSIPYALRPRPEGFTWDLGFPIVYDAVRGYRVLFDPKTLRGTGADYYLDKAATGTGSGTSWANAFTSASAARAALNALGTEPKVLHVRAGTYDYLAALNFDVTILCEDGVAVFADKNVVSWSLVSGSVYSTPVTTAGYVIDTDADDGYGAPLRYTEVPSIVECEALAGSFYRDGTTVYVHSLEGGVPGANVISLTTIAGGYFTKAAHIENLHFYGGVRITGVGNFSAVASKSLYKPNTDSFSVTRDRPYNILLWDCTAGHSFRDGFNYHSTSPGTTLAANVLEVNCLGYENGYDTSVSSNNGSTMHDGGRIIRVNGVYVSNEHRNVHDISVDTEVWMLGCKAGEPRTQTSGEFNRANFLFGIAGTVGPNVWLEACDSLGGADSDYGCYGTSNLKVRNCNINSFTVLAGDGVLSSY